MSRYIDADKTLKAITSQFDDCVCIADVIYVFDNQPTADVRENVRGEWQHIATSSKSEKWKCSVCGGVAYYPHGKTAVCKYAFCPNCGADMRGEQ